MDFCLASLAGMLWLTLSLSLWRRSEKRWAEQSCVKKERDGGESLLQLGMYANICSQSCCFQEFAMQKLQLLKVYRRNRNHDGRECMKAVIRIFSKVRAHPVNTDMGMSCTQWLRLLVSWGAISGIPAAVWEQRSRAGSCHVCVNHQCSFLQFNEALIHPSWTVGPFGFSRAIQTHKVQHLIECFARAGPLLPADWWRHPYSRKGVGTAKLSDKNHW